MEGKPGKGAEAAMDRTGTRSSGSEGEGGLGFGFEGYGAGAGFDFDAGSGAAEGRRRREAAAGLGVLLALAGFGLLLARAGTGPGYLADRVEFDVMFEDGQGVRPGSSVRVSGLEVGQVRAVDLAEFEGRLLARLRVAVPARVARLLREDARIAVQASLTGQAALNVVSPGRSSAPLREGMVVRGIETSPFDPILEKVGLGPEEREGIRGTIARTRALLEDAGPRLRGTLEDAREALATARGLLERTGPELEASSREARELLGRLEGTLDAGDRIAGRLEGLLEANGGRVEDALEDARELAATARGLMEDSAPRVTRLLEGVESIRERAERVAKNGEVLSENAADLMVKNKAHLERAVSNARDATEWVDQIAQKIFSNPFLISPFYRPRAEDLRAQGTVDAARVFLKGAKELNDLVKTLEEMEGRATTEERRAELRETHERARRLTEWLDTAERQLSESLRSQQGSVSGSGMSGGGARRRGGIE